MTAKTMSARIVDWLREHPGQHPTRDIATGLGHPYGSREYNGVSRALSRLDGDGVVASVWVNANARLYSYRQELSARRRRVHPGVLHPHRSIQALGCIPTPVGRVRSAEFAPSPVHRAETVEQFQARGGKVERLPGFETVRPHPVLPMRKAA